MRAAPLKMLCASLRRGAAGLGEMMAGNAAYVWTHDIGRALRAAHSIEAGWVQVNQGLGQTPGHSYGGIKQSGIGREFSLEGMLDSFTQKKNVTVNLNTPSH
jgi:acyl-CoA reductase-like NAD-dependent aldehyde dehydrogenase